MKSIEIMTENQKVKFKGVERREYRLRVYVKYNLQTYFQDFVWLTAPMAHQLLNEWRHNVFTEKMLLRKSVIENGKLVIKKKVYTFVIDWRLQEMGLTAFGPDGPAWLRRFTKIKDERTQKPELRQLGATYRRARIKAWQNRVESDPEAHRHLLRDPFGALWKYDGTWKKLTKLEAAKEAAKATN